MGKDDSGKYIGDIDSQLPLANVIKHAYNVGNAVIKRQQLLAETVQRNDISRENLEDFLYENYKDEESKEYLVDGAILTCTGSKKEIVTVNCKVYKDYSKQDETIGEEVDVSLYADKVLRRLVVTENPPSEVNGLMYATIDDCAKGDNINCFGNCIWPPDNAEEVQEFESHTGLEWKEGTCKYLMNLEKHWDNFEIGQAFLNFPDDDSVKKPGITMTSILFCKHGGFIYPITSGQKEKYEAIFTYIDKDGNIVTVVWTISDEEFVDCYSLTLEEIEKICESHNPELVSRGFAEGIYNYCIENQLNPKVLLATLAQEQGWCSKGNYEKAFGVGPGGDPKNFADSNSGIAASGKVYIDKFNEGLASDSLILKGINRDAGPDYKETKAVYKSELDKWQNENRKYVEYMEQGQDIECVNAAMYAKLRYTPWVDFPPQGSHPLEDWLNIYNSLEDCLFNE